MAFREAQAMDDDCRRNQANLSICKAGAFSENEDGLIFGRAPVDGREHLVVQVSLRETTMRPQLLPPRAGNTLENPARSAPCAGSTTGLPWPLTSLIFYRRATPAPEIY